VPRILGAALLRRRPQVLATAAIIPRLQPYLDRITRKLAQSLKAKVLEGSYPNLQHLREYPAGIMMHNIFERTEARLSKAFEFENLDHQIPDYALACKHSICSYSAEKHLQVLHLNEYSENNSGAALNKVSGLTPLTQVLYEAYYGCKIQGNTSVSSGFNTFLNLLLCLFVISTGIVFSLRRWRPFGFKRESVFLLADFINDQSDLELYKALSEKGRIGLIVRRGLKISDDMASKLQDWRVYKPGDGKLDTRGLLSFLKNLFRDSFRLFFHFKGIESGLFYRFATLPYRRLVMRALFDYLRPDNFWARDPYSPEHIIRTQELHRLGAKSHSILHGFGSMTNLMAQFRYVSFDRFHIFGRFIFEEIYKNTWDRNMTSVPVGSFRGASNIAKYRTNRNPALRDILITMSFLARLNNPDARNIIRGLATAFPERIIRLQVKFNFLDDKMTQDFIKACSDGLDNVIYVDGSFYDYIEISGYAFSDPSTALMECLQYGLPAFMIDVVNFHQACYYRDYPELPIVSTEQAVEKIKNLENGTQSFNPERYEQLICMTGSSPQKAICEGMNF